MANTATVAKKAKSTPTAKRILPTPQQFRSGLWTWTKRNRFCLLAFFIPAILTYIAYAIFGLSPFGEESVLALDFNAQYVYYFEALRDAFWGDGSAFYSWARNLSGGYMGVIGYYLASPFTLIVMLLPEKIMLTSLLLMQLAKVGSAGAIFCFYLQRNKGLQDLHALLFSLFYAMMAYMMIQLIDPMWLDGVVFLPLVCMGVEYLIDDGRKINYIISIAVMFVANFYIGYMIGIFTFFYFLYYLFFGTAQRKRKPVDFFKSIGRFVICTGVALCCSAFMILPVYNALSLGKFDFTDPDYSFATQFDPIDILGQLLVAQYDSVNVQGSPEIYCGILAVVLLPLFFLNKRINLLSKIGSIFLVAVLFVSMYIKPLDMWWHGGQVPNWLPYRYSFLMSFVLLSMAAMAFKHIDGIKLPHIGSVFLGVVVVIFYINKQGYDHLDVITSIWLSIGLAGMYLLLLYLHGLMLSKNKLTKVFPIVMLLVASGELLFNAVQTLKDVDEEVAFSTVKSYKSFVAAGREAVDLLESIDSGLYRSEKTYVRCVNDNLAFGLKGITHSSSVMNAKTITFIETMGYTARSYYTRYDGTTELADSLLGIKYVLDRGDSTGKRLLHDSYTYVDEYTYYEESVSKTKTITIYENPNALSIGYMASSDILKIAYFGNDNPFNSQNIFLSTLTGNTIFDSAGSITDFNEYYTRIETETVLGAVTTSLYNGQDCYTAMSEGDPTIDYRFTVTEEKTIYMYLKTQNEMSVNLWLGVWNEETESYDFTSWGTYFDGGNYCIIDLGEYEVGTQISMRLTIDNDNNATIIKESFFYYFEDEAFQTDIDILKTNQLDVSEYSDTYIKGTVTASEGEILFTTIPEEDGWTVKVDGVKVDYIVAIDTFIAVELSAGEHVVEFSYSAPGFHLGVLLLIIGAAACVVFYVYDKRNNRILVARFKARAEGRDPFLEYYRSINNPKYDMSYFSTGKLSKEEKDKSGESDVEIVGISPKKKRKSKRPTVDSSLIVSFTGDMVYSYDSDDEEEE